MSPAPSLHLCLTRTRPSTACIQAPLRCAHLTTTPIAHRLPKQSTASPCDSQISSQSRLPPTTASPQFNKSRLPSSSSALAPSPHTSLSERDADPVGHDPCQVKGFNQGIRLKKYQAIGLEYMKVREARLVAPKGGLLADEMGLGKTIQALAVIADGRQRGERGRITQGKGGTLIVVPLNILDQWQSEITKFTDSLKVHVQHKTRGSIRSSEDLINFDIVLTTYSHLSRDLGDALFNIDWYRVILDEAQLIRNKKTAMSQACLSLRSSRRWTLSGTPIQNYATDMEAIARFISPNYLTDALVESLARDRRSFVPTSRIDILEDLFRNKGWMLRRSKAEVAHEEVDLRLPDINIKRVTCGFEPRQKRMYQRLIEELQVLLQRLDEIAQIQAGKTLVEKETAITILPLLSALRIVCLNPTNEQFRGPSNPKIAKILELIRQIDQESSGTDKTIIFTNFSSVLDNISPTLEDAGFPCLIMHGKTPFERRTEILRRFQTDPKARVLLMSIQVGGIGLNLTAANRVIITDPWWNVAREDQAISRTHRMGQTKPVTVYRLLMRDSLEEWMDKELHTIKERDAATILGHKAHKVVVLHRRSGIKGQEAHESGRKEEMQEIQFQKGDRPGLVPFLIESLRRKDSPISLFSHPPPPSRRSSTPTAAAAAGRPRPFPQKTHQT